MKHRFAASIAMAAMLVAAPAGVMAQVPADQLVIGLSMSNVLTLDPAEAVGTEAFDILTNIYDRLVEMQPDDPSTVVPGLAESWVVDENGSITFTLRRDAVFQSGNPVTARDAAWSLERVMALNLGPASLLRELGYTAENMADKLTVADDFTLTLDLADPVSPETILYTLARTVGNVVDAETVASHEADGDWGRAWLTNNSAGSGPFSLSRWSANDVVILDRVDGYWRGDAELRRVVLRHIPESQTQRLLIESGDIDVARTLSTTDLQVLGTRDDIEIHKVASGGFYYLAVSTKDGPFAEPGVRAALPWLIDYEGIQASVIGDYGTVRQVPVPDTYPGAIADPGYELDVERAKAILAEAGYPDGFDAEIRVLAEAPFNDIATAVQASLAQAGIRAEILQGNGTQVYGRMTDRDFSMVVGRSGAQMPNVLGAIQAYTSNIDNGPDGPTNSLAWRTSWDIPELTELTAAAREELDDDRRIALYEEIQELLIASDPPLLAIAAATQPAAVRASVNGLIEQQSRSPHFFFVNKD